MAVKPGIISIDASQLNFIAQVLEGLPEEMGAVTKNVLWSLRGDMCMGAAKEIQKVYAVTQKRVRETMQPAKQIGLGSLYESMVAVELVGSRLNLVSFPHTPLTRPVRGGHTKVKPRVTIQQEKKKLLLQPWSKPDEKLRTPFLMPTGAKTEGKSRYFVARRTGEKREKGQKGAKVEAVTTLSIPQMVTDPKVAGPLSAFLLERVNKRVADKLTDAVMRLQRQVSR